MMDPIISSRGYTVSTSKGTICVGVITRSGFFVGSSVPWEGSASYAGEQHCIPEALNIGVASAKNRDLMLTSLEKIANGLLCVILRRRTQVVLCFATVFWPVADL